MEIIAAEEQRLAHDTLVALREQRERVRVPGAEDVGKGAVDGAEVGDELGLVARRRADGDVERARGADGFLHQVGEGPGAADVGRVRWVVGGDGGVVFDEVVYADVGVGGAWGEGEEDG